MRRTKGWQLTLAAALVATCACVAWWSFGRQSWLVGPVTTRDLPGGFLLRDVVLRQAERTITIRCVSGRIDRLHLRVVDIRPFSASPLRSALGDLSAGVAVNGGFFETDRRPVGMMRCSGTLIAERSAKPMLSGVVVGGPDRPPSIVVGDHVEAEATDARQCGPLLIGPRDSSGNRTATAERTAVVMSGDRFGVLVTTPATLDDLAEIVAQHADALGIPHPLRALNLDGGPSSGLIYRDASGLDGAEPRGPISDAILLTNRSPK